MIALWSTPARGGYVTRNLNIKQIQSGARVPACWTAILGGGGSEGQGGWMETGMCEREDFKLWGWKSTGRCKKQCVELNNSWCSTNFDSGENCFLTVPKARQWDQKSKRKLKGRGENIPNQHNIKLTACLRLQVLSKHMNAYYKLCLKLNIHIYAHTDFYAVIGKYYIIIFKNSTLVLMPSLPVRKWAFVFVMDPW